jgi:hypothetical protein
MFVDPYFIEAYAIKSEIANPPHPDGSIGSPQILRMLSELLSLRALLAILGTG